MIRNRTSILLSVFLPLHTGVGGTRLSAMNRKCRKQFLELDNGEPAVGRLEPFLKILREILPENQPRTLRAPGRPIYRRPHHPPNSIRSCRVPSSVESTRRRGGRRGNGRARQAGVLSTNDVRDEEGWPSSDDPTADSIEPPAAGRKPVDASADDKLATPAPTPPSDDGMADEIARLDQRRATRQVD